MPFYMPFAIALSAVMGLVMGSFLNCLAWRTAHDESIAKGRSHCAKCGHTLTAVELVPVLSWLFLRGRCKWCGQKISARYPLTELLTALVYVCVMMRFDVSFAALRFLVLFSVLVAVSLTDIDVGVIPNGLLAAAALGYVLVSLAEPTRLTLLKDGAIGAAALFVPMLVLVLVADKLFKRETMGGGDLKLLAVLGLYFGWQQGILLLLLSCFLGIALAAVMGRAKPNTPFPYGPALSAAAFVTMLAGPQILGWYTGLFGI